MRGGVLPIADTLHLFPILRYGYFEEIRNDQNYFTPSSKLLWEMQMSIHPPHAIVNEENKMKDSNNSSNYRVISNAAFPFCFYSSDSEALGKIILKDLIGSFRTYLEIIQIMYLKFRNKA